MNAIQSAVENSAPVAADQSPLRQFTLPEILVLWAASALPMGLLAWGVAPALVYRFNLPAVLTYWLVLMVGMACQTGIALWVISRREGRLNWAIVRRFARLNAPQDPKTGQPRLRLFWRVLPAWLLLFIILALGMLMAGVVFLLRRFNVEFFDAPFFHWPAYANLTELASPEFAGQWGLIPLVLLGWIYSSLFAEELFFRGVLLPRMRGVFGRGDWAANALLYAFYSLFQYWMIPIRFLEGLILARSARRYSSTWMSVALRGAEGLGLLALAAAGISSQTLTASPTPIQFPMVTRHPPAYALYQGQLAAFPVGNPETVAAYGIDLRGADLSSLDLRSTSSDLAWVNFDLSTIWPPSERMPPGYNPAEILSTAKNPGLGIRSLQAEGITGRGVGVAVIDQTLLVDHEEYASRLRWYEELPGGFAGSVAQMHGPAVASLAVGKTVGVAPEADLYYIQVNSSLTSILFYSHEFAGAIRRILQINARLPVERKIRVISISTGWLPYLGGYHDMLKAVAQAEAAGIMVVNVGTGTGLPEDVNLMGLGRPFEADPEDLGSYGPGSWWSANFYRGAYPGRLVLLPMDSRAMAGAAGPSDYWINRTGGSSWLPPYISGLYAMAVQVDPQVTPAAFWSAVLSTGRTIQVEHAGKSYRLGEVIDPVAVIHKLQGK